MSSRPCIFIAAGGTGGHIYPGLAIAESFKSHKPDVDIFFVGTAQGLENKIVPANGYPILHLPVGKLNQVSLLERLRTLLRLPLAFWRSLMLIRRYKPKLVLGVGGYASGPVLLVAALLRIPTAIWEPNAMPGLTNRWLSRFVDDCFLVFDSAKVFLRIRQTISSGMPIRKEIETAKRRPAASEPRHLLVFGGSQGAMALNSAVASMLKDSDAFALGHKIVHQTGARDFARVKELYGSALEKLDIEVTEYLNDMQTRYAWADIVISRAGAASVAELAACGKVAVLIPLPTAADNHQQKNAEALINQGAATMILQKDLTPESLRATLQKLENDRNLREQMQVQIHEFYQPGAADKIVEHLLQRI